MLGTNFVGKLCAGKPHARFDEGDRWKENLKPVSTLLEFKEQWAKQFYRWYDRNIRRLNRMMTPYMWYVGNYLRLWGEMSLTGEG